MTQFCHNGLPQQRAQYQLPFLMSQHTSNKTEANYCFHEHIISLVLILDPTTSICYSKFYIFISSIILCLHKNGSISLPMKSFGKFLHMTSVQLRTKVQKGSVKYMQENMKHVNLL